MPRRVAAAFALRRSGWASPRARATRRRRGPLPPRASPRPPSPPTSPGPAAGRSRSCARACPPAPCWPPRSGCSNEAATASASGSSTPRTVRSLARPRPSTWPPPAGARRAGRSGRAPRRSRCARPSAASRRRRTRTPRVRSTSRTCPSGGRAATSCSASCASTAASWPRSRPSRPSASCATATCPRPASARRSSRRPRRRAPAAPRRRRDPRPRRLDARHDFADVVGRRPSCSLFATPALCQSRVCGPVVDIAEQVKADHEGDGAPSSTWRSSRTTPSRRATARRCAPGGLPTEPWAFALDRRGRVAARLEGAFSARELEAAVKAAERG